MHQRRVRFWLLLHAMRRRSRPGKVEKDYFFSNIKMGGICAVDVENGHSCSFHSALLRSRGVSGSDGRCIAVCGAIMLPNIVKWAIEYANRNTFSPHTVNVHLSLVSIKEVVGPTADHTCPFSRWAFWACVIVRMMCVCLIKCDTSQRVGVAFTRKRKKNTNFFLFVRLSQAIRLLSSPLDHTYTIRFIWIYVSEVIKLLVFKWKFSIFAPTTHGQEEAEKSVSLNCVWICVADGVGVGARVCACEFWMSRVIW